MSALEAAALRYRPRTVCLLGKRPAVGDGWPDWPATPDSIRAWLTAHGDDPTADVGIRTGGGLVALDIDPRHDGDVSLARLERKYGRLPATPEVATGGGGRHLYFRGPENLRSRDLRHDGIDGVEIKAAGSQLVAPPSVHPDTQREYVSVRPLAERDIAPLPAWVAQLAGDQAVKPSAPDLSGLAERDPLHRIPASVYVPRLTGRPIDRGGYAQCPVHGSDTAPSLKVYSDGGWKCYGCGVGGRIYQLAALLGGWPLPLTPDARRAIRGLLIEEFAGELTA
jgi:hypothetical protein